ncbi:DUF3426 domain-containing protein [uncultured Oxalicibacterium sp.]|uniref:DUF3426 domain-containing protein n=1 Tax=uncultured Oxalicibacterium sp. TaxID=1168540 RepID=UPI0025FDFB50|nr:DUF3426 domain-containing protein [uncultured Oxalicibacterium sp.]
MALATQCPHCQTTFRVVHDQLKLRAGLVRCGYCKEIFNGIEHLLPPDDATASAGTTGREKAVHHQPYIPPPVKPAVATTAANRDVSSFLVREANKPYTTADTDTAPTQVASPAQDNNDEVPPAFTAAGSPSPASVMPTSRLSFSMPAHFEREHPQALSGPVYAAHDEKPSDPLQRMTLMDFDRKPADTLDDLESDQATLEADAAKLDQAMDDLERKPWRRPSDRQNDEDLAIDEGLDQEEPAFLRKERTHRQMNRVVRNTLIVACFVLSIAALLQSAYIFRNQLAGMFPVIKPGLTAICNVIGCRIALPTHINDVSIESSELQTQTGNTNAFVLTVLLRNQSSIAQEWPQLELTLNDANEKPVLRRVFAPAEYVRDQQQLRMGFPAMTERTVRVQFELNETRASGYRVYLFYP